MLPSRPSSTLFPYTTLFRSDAGDEERAVRQVGQRVVVGLVLELLLEVLELRDGLLEAVVLEREDRKSTRLNSSHLVISYAVFCLKKKNDQTLADTNAVECVT